MHEHVHACGKCLHNKTSRFRFPESLEWRYNTRLGVSNHRYLDCLLNRLFIHTPKKISKLRVTDLCEGNPPEPTDTGGFPQKGPVTRKLFPFDDVIMFPCYVTVMERFQGDKFCYVWYQSRYFTMPALSLVFILPFCFQKNIGSYWFSR